MKAIGVNCDHIAIYLVVLLPPRKEVLIQLDGLDEFICLGVDDEQDVVADDQIDLLRSRLFDESQGKLL